MQIFSPTLKRHLKDCILAIFWPKKQICSFFKDCSVPEDILKRVSNFDEISRARIVDTVFDLLQNRHDNGVLSFNLMFEALSNWDHYDEYWFKKIKKLDLDAAKKKVALLKSKKKKLLIITENVLHDKAKKPKLHNNGTTLWRK